MLVVGSDRQVQGKKKERFAGGATKSLLLQSYPPFTLLSSLLINKESVQYNLECDYVFFLCALLLFIIVTLLCSSMSPGAMLHALVVHQHLRAAHSCCSSVPPYCAILMLIGAFFTMHSCCSSMYCCYALLLLINILSLCTFVICWHLLDVHSSCFLTPPCYTPLLLINALSPRTLLTPQCSSSPLDLCLCCLLAPPCCVLLLLIGTSLLSIFYVRSTPPYCALLLLIGTSLLCTHVTHWHLLAMCF